MQYKITDEIIDNVLILSITATMSVDKGYRILSKELAVLKENIKTLTRDRVRESMSFYDRYLMEVDYNLSGLSKENRSKYRITLYLKPIDCGDKDSIIDEVVQWYRPVIDSFCDKYGIR